MNNKIYSTELLQPERLIQGRMIRGLTRPYLAEKIGVSRQVISQYELGRCKPSSEILHRYADFLNLPYQFFLTPEPPCSENPVCFRKLTKTKESEMNILKIFIRWMGNVVSFLKKEVTFPIVNLPTRNEHEHFYSNDEIEQIADNLRKIWGLSKGPIENMSLLLENNGFVISHFKIKNENVDACTVQREDLGDYIDDNYIRPFVCLTSKSLKSACRARFSLAHELGHIMLHSWVDDDYLQDEANKKRIEAEAQYFAGAFLMPLDTFAMELYGAGSLQTYLRLKKRWKVSIAAMIQRAKNLSILTDMQYESLQVMLSVKRMRKVEPMDDEIILEKPTMIAKAISLLLENAVLSEEEILHKLALPVEELNQICAYSNISSPFRVNNKIIQLNSILLKNNKRAFES